MIVPLDVSQREVAEQILAVQIPAYQVEAEWIGFQGIPHLHETITSLMQSNLTFYGYRKDGCIAGVIAYEKKQRVLEIDRLVVHPQYFRQGIGQCLIQFVLDNETDVDKYTLSTGAANFPALKLYQKLGFTEVKQLEIAPGVCLTFMEKPVSI